MSGGSEQIIKQIPLTCSGHIRPVVDCVWSKELEDGLFICSACLDGQPMIREGRSGDWIGTFVGHKGAVWSIDINFDATMVATGSADWTTKLWNAISGDEVHSFAHKHIVKSVCFSSNGGQLLAAGNEKKLKMWDLGSPDSEPVVFEGHTSAVKKALFGADDTIIFSGGQDNVVRVWDTRSRADIKTLDTPGSITSMELSRNGTILTVTAGKNVLFYDTKTFDTIHSYPISTMGELDSATLHPTDAKFLAGGQDTAFRMFDFDTGSELECNRGHHGPIHCLRFSPSGDTYASGSDDSTLRIWKTNVKAPVQ